MKETYLGDGLYVSFDGFQFKLRAPRKNGDHNVYLDTRLYGLFKDYAEAVLKPKNHEP